MFGFKRRKPPTEPLVDHDVEREEFPIPVDQLEAGLDSPFWRWLEGEMKLRIKTTRDFLETNQLEIEGMPQFESIQVRDQFLKGQCSELRWLLESPRTLLELMKDDVKEQQGHE